jgi:hypothetical protein
VDEVTQTQNKNTKFSILALIHTASKPKHIEKALIGKILGTKG